MKAVRQRWGGLMTAKGRDGAETRFIFFWVVGWFCGGFVTYAITGDEVYVLIGVFIIIPGMMPAMAFMNKCFWNAKHGADPGDE